MTDDLELWTNAAGPYAAWSKHDPLRRELLEPALTRVIGDPSGLLVADLGCGDGALAASLAAGGARIRACDAIPSYVDTAIRALPSDARVVQHDLLVPLPEDEVFPSSSFDLVLVVMVLHALADIAPLLGSVARILKPSGRGILALRHPAFTPPAAYLHAGVLGRFHPRFWRTVVVDYFTDKRLMWKIQGSSVPPLPVYHRTLEALITPLSAAGLAITGLHEPRPEDRSAPATIVAGHHARSAPIHLILEVQRHG